MNITRRIKVQLAAFVAVVLISVPIMAFGYADLLSLLFGVGLYTVTLELPASGGLYKNANVTYRGTEIGRVEDVRLNDIGVAAVLSLESGIAVPSDLRAEVHSVSAIGEQYVALVPRSNNGAPLKNGDVIVADRASIPAPIDELLDATDRGLQAIPRDNLKTVVDESSVAFGGLGGEFGRLVRGATQVAIDARASLDQITTLIDQSAPLLDAQADGADAIQSWAAHLNVITGGLKTRDAELAGILSNGGGAAEQARDLLEKLQPTLPTLLANLVSAGKVAVAYQPAIEQLLVLLPQGIRMGQGTMIPNLNTKQAYKANFLDFNLNLNVPPPCTTGFLPASQRRAPSLQDAPPRPPGDLYCRIPQDAPFDVRGARNLPCLTVPGKRAPTVKMCESDEQYTPLNDGENWKGDPNATLSGQDVPQLPPAVPPIAVATYDPATGTYVGPDGKVYTQTDLAPSAGPKEWQAMLVPPN